MAEPFMPPPSKVGRPREVDWREVLNAIQRLAATGCQWSRPLKNFPPFKAVQHDFYQLRDGGTLDALNETLAMAARLIAGREAAPTAEVFDSRSVKTTESGGPRGFDAGKKINGRKRHILTDTQGHLLTARVHTADIQDRDGAVGMIEDACESFPTIVHLFADGGYAGDKLQAAVMTFNGPNLEIVRRTDEAKGFAVIVRRWVVERTLAWLGRCRRLAKHWESTIASSEAWLLVASLRQLSRRVARA